MMHAPSRGDTVARLQSSESATSASPTRCTRSENEDGPQGWQLKAITSVEVKGRVGPGGVEGLLVTFERPVG
jgi:hypothetical protein